MNLSDLFKRKEKHAMIMVPSGKFMMGDNRGEEDASPIHEVKISNPFFISVFPITIKEFRQYVSETRCETIAEKQGWGFTWNGKQWNKTPNSYWNNPNFSQSDNNPVTCVTWYDTLEFCNWLSQKDGFEPCYKLNKREKDPNNIVPSDGDEYKWLVECNFGANGYRLPTEAEWEYAAKGGNKSRNYKYSGSNVAAEVAWFIDRSKQAGIIMRKEDYFAHLNNGSTVPVGKKRQNELGLFDMSGNVREWCWDWYSEKYYSTSPNENPKGETSGSSRINRGGSWQADMVNHLSPMHRNYGWPASVFTHNGFRVVRLG